MPDQERVPQSSARPPGPAFGEVLAACAAAEAVSRPPREPEPRPVAPLPREEEPARPVRRPDAA